MIHLFLEKQAQIPKSGITSGAKAFRFIFSVILASDKSLMCVFNLCFFFPLPMLSYFTQNNCHSVTLYRYYMNNFKSVLNSGSQIWLLPLSHWATKTPMMISPNNFRNHFVEHSWKCYTPTIQHQNSDKLFSHRHAKNLAVQLNPKDYLNIFSLNLSSIIMLL